MTNPYSPDFFEGHASGSRASAQAAVPIVYELIKPNSVLDVGCGIGLWTSAWIDHGVDDVIGVDGGYIDRRSLHIPSDQFVVHDLAKPLDLGRKFDLVTCLEVAEHLPDHAAATLVESLVRHADIVAFSAAIPGQGGTGHINEQWPSYWAAHFAREGYRPFDILRGRLWYSGDVMWWYRQNSVVFAKEEAANRLGLIPSGGPLDIVHPVLFEQKVDPGSLSSQALTKVRARLSAFGRTPAGRPLRALKRRIS